MEFYYMIKKYNSNTNKVDYELHKEYKGYIVVIENRNYGVSKLRNRWYLFDLEIGLPLAISSWKGTKKEVISMFVKRLDDYYKDKLTTNNNSFKRFKDIFEELKNRHERGISA